MENLPDHPIIRRAERTGYERPVSQIAICPVCGGAATTIYTDLYGETVGCDLCVTATRIDEED